jgi:hypothetical protein
VQDFHDGRLVRRAVSEVSAQGAIDACPSGQDGSPKLCKIGLTLSQRGRAVAQSGCALSGKRGGQALGR